MEFKFTDSRNKDACATVRRRQEIIGHYHIEKQDLLKNYPSVLPLRYGDYTVIVQGDDGYFSETYFNVGRDSAPRLTFP